MKKYNIAIVGATGLVGRTFLKIMEEESIPVASLRLFASAKSKGKTISYAGQNIGVEELKEDCFEKTDFALFSAGGEISRQWAPVAEGAGAVVIDNSSFWRMEEDCALLVPEINFEDYRGKRSIIANPNCSTIQCVLPLKPLHDSFGLTRVQYSTYQACSGSGQKGMEDLERCRNGESNTFYPYNIAETCIPEIDAPCENGYTKEEMKMIAETQKILRLPHLPISATCVRVPVRNAHGVCVSCFFEKPIDRLSAIEALKKQPGIAIADDLSRHIYPVSTVADGKNTVFVGRIRKDLSCENGLLFYCVCDNIRKGAAANAVQIMQRMIRERAK